MSVLVASLRTVFFLSLCCFVAKSQTTACITSIKCTQRSPSGLLTLFVQQNGKPLYNLNQDSISILDNNLPVLNFMMLNSPTPATRVPISVALVLDRSWSMITYEPTNRFDGVKTAAKAFIDKLDEKTDEAELISFASTYSIDIFMTNDLILLQHGIDAIRAFGSTALYDATAVGIQEVTNNGTNRTKALIVVTDGVDNKSPIKLNEVIKFAQCSNVRIFTIGIGPFIKDSVLQVLANESGGQYFKCRTGCDVIKVFPPIADFMHRNFDEHTLAYISPDYLVDDHYITARLSIDSKTIIAMKDQHICNPSVSSMKYDPAEHTPSITLEQNTPNPFSTSTGPTIIRFSLEGLNTRTNVILTVHDLLGREVKTLLKDNLESGSYSVKFDGSSLPSGMYFYKLTTGTSTLVKKMMITR